MFNTTWNEKQRSTKRKGWCYEWTEERRNNATKKFKEAANSWSMKVKCIKDCITFNTIVDAATYYGVKKSTLSGHLHNRQKTCCGKHFEFIQK